MSKRIRMIDRLQVNYYLAVGFFYGGIFMGSSRLAMLANKSLNNSDNIDEKKNYSKEEIIERDLQRDLQNDRFKIYYQSKHDVKSGKIVGAEALVRWDHKELGMLSPMEFIPIFEKNGSIKDLDMIVREKVFLATLSVGEITDTGKFRFLSTFQELTLRILSLLILSLTA